MRTLTQNELVQLNGGIHLFGEYDDSRIFVIGAVIGALISNIGLETGVRGTLVAATTSGMLFSVLLDPEIFPRKSNT